MKKTFPILALCLLSNFINAQSNQKPAEVDVIIDGTKKLQQIDGIGVNVNTRSWNGNELIPALDLLIDSMHASIWRVIVETVEKWEDVNDNNDPFSFNWEYYNKLYETPKFQKVWNMMRYLNDRGIADKLMINFMGFAPKWMGVKVILPEYEDEYVEMILSFFYYALKTKHLKFGFIAPTNESDHHQYSEGPHLDGKQHTRIIRKLIQRMESLGIMNRIRIVAPDNASTDKAINEFIPAMMDDPLVMSKTGRLGFHSYGGYTPQIGNFIRQSRFPDSRFWMTEWNAWCNGCDDGILGEYDFNFAKKSVNYLLDILKNGASAAIAWEGYDSYYEHHAPSPFSYWGLLAYDSVARKYPPRKTFYAIQQVSRFINPGCWQLPVTLNNDSLIILSVYDQISKSVSVIGINKKKSAVSLDCNFLNLPAIHNQELFYTDSEYNFRKSEELARGNNKVTAQIPADCIFAITASGSIPIGVSHISPEPAGWYAGDIHVHKNCGDENVIADSLLPSMMEKNNLAVISVLADMGNGEVKYSQQDLKKVNGKDAPESKPGRIMHWDTEWHWDATYSQFSNQALGGHLVLLGLKNAKQIWNESPYKILEWARQQDAVKGFAHFEYLNDSIQNDLNCCIPIDYPVEAALKTIDFVSEDVYSNKSAKGGNYNSEAFIKAYYRLLNCGFRIGLAAGTDYPCNDKEPLGNLLTYAHVNGKLTYSGWIRAIKEGKTVVSRNGHNEFLDLKVNQKYGPGEETNMNKGDVSISVKWSSLIPATGTIELVLNGKIIATHTGNAAAGKPLLLNIKKPITESGWLCARRMDANEHQTHTAPVFITVDKKPMKANPDDVNFFIHWIDNILENIKPGGKWRNYFPETIDSIERRYLKAKTVYQRMQLREAVNANVYPILILATQKNAGLYTAEILKAEGFNEFQLDSIADKKITTSYLAKFHVIILAEDEINDKQKNLFETYVRNGGNLVAFAPPGKMNDVFGIKQSVGTIKSPYIWVDTMTKPGKGIISKALQTHVDINTCELTSAKAIASFVSGKKSVCPAVTENNFGKGRSVAFLYNLPQNIIYTRQGNPADASKEKDGITGIRAMDLFTNGWVDTLNNCINQADEQMRLLTHCIQNMMSKRMPLPRLWYFPNKLSSLITLNNDGEDTKEDEFNAQFHDVDAKAAKMSLYIKETDLVSREWTDKWQSKGFEISGHPDDTKQATNPDWATMDSVYTDLLVKLGKRYGITGMHTVVNHWFVWCGKNKNGDADFTAQAKLEEKHGVGLDANYAHYDNGSDQGHFLGAMGTGQGNYTGSGLAMKFADEDGKILDIYQHLNNVYDQQYMEHRDSTGFYNCFKGLLDRSMDNEVYSFVSIKAHNNEYFFSKTPLLQMLDYASLKNIPVWTEYKLLEFLRAKENTVFNNMDWSNNQLSFEISSPVKFTESLTCMIPNTHNGISLSNVYVDGKETQYIVRKIKGTAYALFDIKPGNNYHVTVAYSKPVN